MKRAWSPGRPGWAEEADHLFRQGWRNYKGRDPRVNARVARLAYARLLAEERTEGELAQRDLDLDYAQKWGEA